MSGPTVEAADLAYSMFVDLIMCTRSLTDDFQMAHIGSFPYYYVSGQGGDKYISKSHPCTIWLQDGVYSLVVFFYKYKFA
jgi:hypothetical protein